MSEAGRAVSIKTPLVLRKQRREAVDNLPEDPPPSVPSRRPFLSGAVALANHRPTNHRGETCRHRERLQLRSQPHMNAFRYMPSHHEHSLVSPSYVTRHSGRLPVNLREAQGVPSQDNRSALAPAARRPDPPRSRSPSPSPACNHTQPVRYDLGIAAQGGCACGDDW